MTKTGKLFAHVTDLVKCFIAKFDPGSEVAIFEMWEELIRLPFGLPLCSFFTAQFVKTSINMQYHSEVIETLIGIENYMIAAN